MKLIEKQITFRHKLAYYLGMNYLQYENIRYRYFLEWCEVISHMFCLPFEEISKYDSLQNWFDDQWVLNVESKIKAKYDDVLERFSNEDIMTLLAIYFEDNIYDFYPKTLVNEIRKELKKSIKNNSYEHESRKTF